MVTGSLTLLACQETLRHDFETILYNHMILILTLQNSQPLFNSSIQTLRNSKNSFQLKAESKITNVSQGHDMCSV